MGKISFKGVIFGGFVDVTASYLASIPIAVVLAIHLNVGDLPKAERTRVLTAAMHNSSGYLLAGLIVGCLGSVLAGYVAGRIARMEFVLNGALSAWLGMTFGIISLFGKPDGKSPLQHALLIVAGPLLGAIGGWLARRHVSTAPVQRGLPPWPA